MRTTMNKSQVIAAIQQINPTAKANWLDHFETTALRRYLDHLQLTLEPRGVQSAWIRPGETPAVVWR